MSVVVETKFGIRPEWREAWYRFVGGIAALLLALGYLANEEAALWTQLGLTSVTLLFAALFATTTVRAVIYPVLVAVGALATWYGLVSAEQWPLILAAVVQIVGLQTASTKVVQLVPKVSPPPTLAA